MESFDSIPPPSQIEPNLWICDFYNLYDPRFLPGSGINAVVSMLDDYAPLFTRPEFTSFVSPKRHLFVKCSDTKTEDLIGSGALDRIYAFIERMMLTETDMSNPEKKQSGTSVVLVHCEEGVSRSPTAVTAYLMKRDGKGLDEVLAMVKGKRKFVEPSNNFLGQLHIWEQRLKQEKAIT